MSQSEALLPCPFCGGEAELDTMQPYRNFSTGRMETAIAVYCIGGEHIGADCAAQISVCRGDDPNVQPDEVIALWNRRADLSPAISEELVERLRHQVAQWGGVSADACTEEVALLRDLLAALSPTQEPKGEP